jgi:hypothetical protein
MTKTAQAVDRSYHDAGKQISNRGLGRESVDASVSCAAIWSVAAVAVVHAANMQVIEARTVGRAGLNV